MIDVWRPWKCESSCVGMQQVKTLMWRFWASLLQAQRGLTSFCQFHLQMILRKASSPLRKEANAPWNSPSLSPTTSFLVSNTPMLFGKLVLEVWDSSPSVSNFNWLNSVVDSIFHFINSGQQKEDVGNF